MFVHNERICEWGENECDLVQKCDAVANSGVRSVLVSVAESSAYAFVCRWCLFGWLDADICMMQRMFLKIEPDIF